jgi:replicative DNA helicase
MSIGQRVDAPRRPKSLSPEILDRQPPCNLEAEIAVLGSILILPHVCDDVALIVRPDDFYDDAHRILFTNMLALHDAGRKIDPTLLTDHLKTAGDYDRIGGAAYLAKVINSVATAAHAKYYAEIVRDKATYRALINASTETLRDAYDEAYEANDALNQAEQRVFAILDKRDSGSVSSIRDIMHLALDRIDARLKGEHAAAGVDTGFTELDALTGGLHRSELVVLAARPSMGKTALAMNIAEAVSMRYRTPVFFVSLEMSSMELADRMLCSVARVNGHRLRNGTLSREDRQRLVEKAGLVSEAPLFVDDSPNRTVTQVAAAARRVSRRCGGLGLIVIDYLQLIEPDNSKDPRQEQVARITRRLKGLAREMTVPVLCLAQLNRQAEAAKENRPRLNHLRESGAIEQDADVVMFVHREEYYHTGEDRDQYAGQAEIIVAKQRNGPVGDIELHWHKEYTRFENREHRENLQEFDAHASGID